MFSIRNACLLALAFLSCGFTHQTTLPRNGQYFWAASGSDVANCMSQITPCLTATKFNNFPFPANAVASFKGGDTFNSQEFTLFTDRVTVNSYGGTQAQFTPGNGQNCIRAINYEAITVNNINCVGTGNSHGNSTESGFTISTTINKGTGDGTFRLAGPTITNNTISGFGANGIELTAYGYLSSVGAVGYNNTTVNNNIIHDVTGNYTFNFSGCIVMGFEFDTNNTLTGYTNTTVNNNTVSNCTGDASANQSSGNGILLINVSTATISSNVAHDYGTLPGHCGGPAGIWTTRSNHATIQFNEVYNGNKGQGGACDGQAFDLDISNNNTILQYNYAHDMLNADGSLLFCACGVTTPNTWDGNQVRFNIFSGGGVADVLVTQNVQPITNSSFYNNTIISVAGEDAFKWIVGNGTLQVSNNILYNFSGGHQLLNTATTPNYAGNDYFTTGTLSITYSGTTYTTLAAFQAATGQEKVGGNPVGTSANPSLANAGAHPICGGYTPLTCPSGYHPNGGSPVLPNAGLNLQADFSINPGSQDFYGFAVTTATLPIGAAAN